MVFPTAGYSAWNALRRSCIALRLNEADTGVRLLRDSVGNTAASQKQISGFVQAKAAPMAMDHIAPHTATRAPAVATAPSRAAERCNATPERPVLANAVPEHIALRA